MECKKYEIIEDGGRKRIRSLRDFTVQDRHVCVGDLGGYVYNERTLAQKGNAWIFSGSLEYPCVHVLDEAIVDMGNNLPRAATRPKATIISGNSRIMGAISFETRTFDVVQTPAMFEQGGSNVTVGRIPVKSNTTTRVRISAPLFVGTTGTVVITSTAYEARLISLDEAGIVTDVTGWTVGGPAVTLISTAPYILAELRKVGGTAITPADVTAAGMKITRAREAMIRISNSSIVPVYNGAVASASKILNYEVTDPSEEPYQVNIQNSYLRIECTFNVTNAVRANADFINVNYNLVLTPGKDHFIVGTYRNTNINTPASVSAASFGKRLFDVSDCPNFEFSSVVFPDLTAMYASGKTFYFKQCNMPVGSAIHYYDPKVNVWDNIDFTKASEHLGKTLPKQAQTMLVSSTVEGMYRLYRNADDKVFGMLVQDYASVENMGYGALESSYGSVVYSDCVLDGVFNIIGRNVFGGTLGGASKITNTGETAMVINGSFRIEGNAQVVDTPLKGTGYIGGNAELKNGVVEGYIYMADNAKYIPAAVTNAVILKHLIMTGNSKVLRQRDVTNNHVKMELSDNAVVDSATSTDRGFLKMSGNAYLYSTGAAIALLILGTLEMKEDAKQVGGTLTVHGDITLTGRYNQSKGHLTITGKRVISDVSQIAVADIPPTKTTW